MNLIEKIGYIIIFADMFWFLYILLTNNLTDFVFGLFVTIFVAGFFIMVGGALKLKINL